MRLKVLTLTKLEIANGSPKLKIKRTIQKLLNRIGLDIKQESDSTRYVSDFYVVKMKGKI